VAKKDVNGQNPAVAVAATAGKKKEDTPHTLSTGVKVKINPVSTGLIQTVMGKVKDPKVPKFYDKDRDREIDNPNHPDYVSALREAQEARGTASLDAMIMFGLELLEPIPPFEEWGPMLQYLGVEVDETNPLDIEFKYKKHVAMGSVEDQITLSTCSGIRREAVSEAIESFQREEG
jgi:hypothetical protein